MYAVPCQHMSGRQLAILTSCNLVNLMLYEEVNHGNNSSKEGGGNVFSVPNGFRIGRAQGEAAKCPRDRGYEIRNHEDIVPVMIIS